MENIIFRVYSERTSMIMNCTLTEYKRDQSNGNKWQVNIGFRISNCSEARVSCILHCMHCPYPPVLSCHFVTISLFRHFVLFRPASVSAAASASKITTKTLVERQAVGIYFAQTSQWTGCIKWNNSHCFIKSHKVQHFI